MIYDLNTYTPESSIFSFERKLSFEKKIQTILICVKNEVIFLQICHIFLVDPS